LDPIAKEFNPVINDSIAITKATELRGAQTKSS
jgi:hypothetical protein